MALNPDYPKLKHNPFVTPRDTFFGGGERQSQLNQLRHLAQWSRRLLVVTGAHGMGKTTMFKALGASLPPSTKAARIMGTLVGSARDVLVEIVQGFGIAIPEDANSELLNDLIRDHVVDQGERFCVVLIDDAHLIEPRAIQPLLDLLGGGTAGNGLHMVLFAEVQILGVLERAAKRPNSDLAWHQVPLNTLDNPGIREYLLFRFAEAGHQGRMPFSERQIQQICQQSRGIPGRIDESADRELINLERIDRRFPSLHRSVVLLLLVVVVAAYVLWDRFDGDEAVSLDLPALAVGEAVIALPPRPGANEVGNPAADVAEQAPAVIEPPPVAQPVAPLGSPIITAVTPSEPASEPADVTLGSDQSAERPPRPVVSTVAEAELALPEPQEAEVALPIAEQPAVEPTTTTTVASSAQVTPAAAVGPGEDSGPSADAAAASEAHDASWILAQDPGRYTLQLLSTSSIVNLNAYIAKQASPGDFAFFRSSRADKPFYVLLYGLYDSKELALEGARRLPATVGDVKPWARRLGAVQQAVQEKM